MTAYPTDRWHVKGDALARAWHSRFAAWPALGAVRFVLVQAEVETSNGDAKGWEGEHDEGATQLRTLTPEEKAVLADAHVALPLSFAQIAGQVALARAALSAAVDAGRIPVPSHKGIRGALHVDTSDRLRSPGNPMGAYWMLFAAFDDDEAGYAYYLGAVARHRALLEAPGTTVQQYAAALRGSGYYEGIYGQDKHYTRAAGGRWIEDPNGSMLGRDLNVANYAAALAHWMPEVTAALADWQPPTSMPAPLTDAQRAWYDRLDGVRSGTAKVGLDAIDELEAAPDTEPAPRGEVVPG